MKYPISIIEKKLLELTESLIQKEEQEKKAEEKYKFVMQRGNKMQVGVALKAIRDEQLMLNSQKQIILELMHDCTSAINKLNE